jgi:aspartate/methionine/tyrosine aminotransferase
MVLTVPPVVGNLVSVHPKAGPYSAGVVARRLAAFGNTVFTDITRMAVEHQAINLGQGFPNFDGPDFVKEAAVAAVRGSDNQYPPSMGIEALRRAIAARWGIDTGMTIDSNTQITVTSGCTEALAATFLGLINPGDEVIVIEPFYDAYPVGVELAGGVPRYVTLRPPGFNLDPDEISSVLSPRSRMIVINTPHNPTGRVFGRDELEAIADICQSHDLIAVTDEVYERMVFDGQHLRLAALPGMWSRTLTLSSLGKSFSLTGWKTGWAIGPELLTAGVRAAHQFLTFTTPNPMQYAAAAALAAPDSYYRQLVAAYRRRRDLLADGLAGLGFGVTVPQGTYFLMADHTHFGLGDDVRFVHHLIREVGVAAIPPSAFYHRPSDGKSLVRFAFCKDEETLSRALDRLSRLAV